MSRAVGVAVLLWALIAGGAFWLTATTIQHVDDRLAAVETFVQSRQGVAPSDVLTEAQALHVDVIALRAWMETHATLCQECRTCEACKRCGVAEPAP